MVVNKLNIVGIAIAPNEANAPLFVDAGAVLTSALAVERFQPVSRRAGKIIQGAGSMKQAKTAQHTTLQFWREPLNVMTMKDFFGVSVDKRENHH
jgi:hypothetical protein